MLIREITLRNLLSFGPETPPFALRKLSILIGPNGSGKSNFIEAIGLLRALPTDISEPLRKGGGVAEWIYKGVPWASATIEVESTPIFYFEWLRHRFTMSPSSAGTCLIYNEHIAVSKVGEPLELIVYSDEGVESKQNDNEQKHENYEHFVKEFDVGQSILAQPVGYGALFEAVNGRAAPREGLTGLSFLEGNYKKIKVYKDWGFGTRCPARKAEGTDERWDLLSPSFDNLAAVLSDLKSRPVVKRKILDMLSGLYGGITDFHVVNREGKAYLYLEEGDYTIPSSRLSDGTLRYLALLAILCHPEPPPLICIEEPELGLHPDALLTICKMIEEASERTQLIITTHSEFIVDYFSRDPEAIVVCEKGENGTTMNRLDEKELEGWLKEYTLGNLWRSGQIGGNRW